MENTGYNSDQVYILRQTFQPNEPFREALAKLVATGSNGARHFSIYGSDQRVIDMADTRSHEFALQLREADAYLGRRAASSLLLQSGIEGFIVRGREPGRVALRLLIKPEINHDYTYVQGALDIVKMGRRERMTDTQESTLLTTIPQEHLLPLREVKQRLANINQALGDTATHRLYGVVPSKSLVGRSLLRKARSADGGDLPETRAS